MATYKSNLISRGIRYRAGSTTCEKSVRGRVVFPAGTVLAATDVIEMVYLGENQVIRSFDIVGLDLGAAAANLGHLQILDKDGNPVVVETKGPAGPANTKFASPATNATAFASASGLNGATEINEVGFVVPGPITVAFTVTTGATLANGGELHLVTNLLSEMAPPGEFEGDTAYNYKSEYPLD